MITINLGPCRRRSRALEEIDKPDTSDETLSRIFDFLGFINSGLGGHRIILNFLKDASRHWPDQRPITILELRCGRGDLSAAILRWARKKKIDVRILAIDECPTVIELAREYNENVPGLTFEVRLLSDPRFLEAQQFDYVISSSALHSVDSEQSLRLLKTANLLAKRGIIFCDWLRDLRAWLWVRVLSWFWGDELAAQQALLGIKKGFTTGEMRQIASQAAVEYTDIKMHLGYRFSISGERGLVIERRTLPVARLAGA